MDGKEVNFVFTTCRLVMGGNETLIFRMSNWLLEQGHTVTIITAQGGYMADKMPKACNVYIVGSFNFGAAVIPFFPYKKSILNAFKTADVVMSFSGGGCMFAYHLFNRFSSDKSRLLAGVFHPNTGVSEIPYFNSVFWNSVFDENKIYMNTAILEDHRNRRNMVDNVNIWTLPVINDFDSNTSFDGFNSNIILSIGRLTEFKGYNYYMIDVIKDLVDFGFKNIEWHVIGDDEPDTREPVKEYMESKIKEYNLDNNIKLHGIVDYNQLPLFINRSKIFVGMGTAAVEACAKGLPTICAIVDDKEGYTYGYMWDQPKGCVGERLVNSIPKVKVYDLIKEVLCSDKLEYQQLSSKAKSITNNFLVDNQMREFLSVLNSTKVGVNIKPLGRFRHIIKKLFKKLFKKLM